MAVAPTFPRAPQTGGQSPTARLSKEVGFELHHPEPELPLSPRGALANSSTSFGNPAEQAPVGSCQRAHAHVDAWNAEAVVGPQQMGRSAAKVESVEETLKSLENSMEGHAAILRSYLGRTRSGMQTSWGFRGSPGEVVGVLDADSQHVAKSIEPERLKFWGTPTFDPGPFLDLHNKQTFQRPLDFAAPADLDEFRPPRVRVRVDGKDKIALLEKLDAGERLALVPLRVVRQNFLNGVFAVPKDSERDRMVLDARPPNLLESNSDPWLGSLGSLSQLNHFFFGRGRGGATLV